MKSDEFELAIKNKKVPLLVLDQKWHRLFAIHGKTDEIKAVEEALTSLLAEQGKANNDLKELKKLKTKLMESIVQNMDGASSNASDSRDKLDNNKLLIEETNRQIEEKQDFLLEVPKQIKETNEKLMLLSMDYFYSKIRINQTESKEIEEWIRQVRIDLKRNIIKKQNRDINNREIYSYLHDIFGVDVIDLFDIKYDKESEDSDIPSDNQ